MFGPSLPVSREEVYGVTTIEAINEVTHRLMLAEALAAGVIRRARAQELRGKTEPFGSLDNTGFT